MTPTKCAWCPTFDPTASAGVSHGICPTCAARVLAGLPAPVSEVERTIEEAQRPTRDRRRGHAHVAALALLLLLVASVASAQDVASPVARDAAMALIVGSSLDLATTLQTLHTAPLATEGNPLLAHGGTAGLIAVKVGLTIALVVGVTRLMPTHPTVARLIGWTGGALFAGVASRNARGGR